jgi:hypothetical protein
MWHVCDDLHFACKTLHGDGSITAKIDSIDPSHYSIQAGVMIRNTLDPASPQASVVVTPLGDVAFQYRTVELGAAKSIYRSTVPNSLDGWVRLTRKGNRFTAEHSLDGANWRKVSGDETPNEASSLEIPMNQTVYLGLVLTSYDPSGNTQARISHVTTTGNTSPFDFSTKFQHIALPFPPAPHEQRRSQ